VSTGTLDAEIDGLRQELTDLVAELDRRRHELLDVKLQLRRHARPVGLVGLALAGAVAGAIALRVRRTRRARALTGGRGALGQLVGRALQRPEPVRVEATVLERIAGAAGSAAAVYLVKAGLDRLLARADRPGDRR
jgi:hypothetical protein